MPSYPPPASSGPEVMLARVEDREGIVVEPKRQRVQVLYSDGCYRPACALAWSRAVPARKRLLTGHMIEWLIQLQTEDGVIAWYEYVAVNVSVV